MSAGLTVKEWKNTVFGSKTHVLGDCLPCQAIKKTCQNAGFDSKLSGLEAGFGGVTTELTGANEEPLFCQCEICRAVWGSTGTIVAEPEVQGIASHEDDPKLDDFTEGHGRPNYQIQPDPSKAIFGNPLDGGLEIKKGMILFSNTMPCQVSRVEIGADGRPERRRNQ